MQDKKTIRFFFATNSIKIDDIRLR